MTVHTLPLHPALPLRMDPRAEAALDATYALVAQAGSTDDMHITATVRFMDGTTFPYQGSIAGLRFVLAAVAAQHRAQQQPPREPAP